MKPEGHESAGYADYYLKHQEEVVTRRTKYDLNKAEKRAHILKGLLKALELIDEVITIIRGSQNADREKNLMERFRNFLMCRHRLSWICVCVL